MAEGDDSALDHESRHSRVVDIQYNEYARLADKADEHVRGSFGDAGSIGTVLAVLAWPPIADGIGDGSDVFMFLGFMAMYVLFATLALFNGVRDSLAFFYVTEMASYGSALRRTLGVDNGVKLADGAKTWDIWFLTGHATILRTFYGTIVAILAVLPGIVLGFRGAWTLAITSWSIGVVGATGFSVWKHRFFERAHAQVRAATRHGSRGS